MNISDLVLCNWQPTVSFIDERTRRAEPMKHYLKGEVGIITEMHRVKRPGIDRVRGPRTILVFFPKFNYFHWLSVRRVDVISEAR